MKNGPKFGCQSFQFIFLPLQKKFIIFNFLSALEGGDERFDVEPFPFIWLLFQKLRKMLFDVGYQRLVHRRANLGWSTQGICIETLAEGKV